MYFAPLAHTKRRRVGTERKGRWDATHTRIQINPVSRSRRESKAEFSRLASVNICPWVAHYMRVVMRSNYALCLRFDALDATHTIKRCKQRHDACFGAELNLHFYGITLVPLCRSHDHSHGRIKRYSYSCNTIGRL